MLKLIGGGAAEQDIPLEAKPIFTESCGCRSVFADDMKLYKKSAYKLIDSCRTDISLLNRMTSELAETETAEENISVISRFISELECERCCICLCSEWNGAFNEKWRGRTNDEYQIHGYTKTMSAPLIWDKGEISSVASFQSADMQPEPLNGGGNVSYFLPLHFRERCLGYYVVTNGDFPIKSLLCHSLMMNISNSIENIRKLLNLNSVIQELDRLYVIDPLCGIFNRNGFVHATESVYRDCVDNHRPIMLMFIDLDGLKRINDTFGHSVGDNAICSIAEVLRTSCRSGEIYCRFGGDEFIIFGADYTEAEAKKLKERIKRNIRLINEKKKKPYRLSASAGYVIETPKQGEDIFRFVTAADNIMYEEKRRKKVSRYLKK